jgi:hypothetical protein
MGENEEVQIATWGGGERERERERKREREKEGRIDA